MAATGRATAPSLAATRWIFRPTSARWACRRGWPRPSPQPFATADRYPDPFCRALREKLAAHEGVPAEQLLCGNGAADLIFRLVGPSAPARRWSRPPTFAEYAAALETVGCTVERYFLREADDFAVTEAFCGAIDDSVDMVFLCQPNNPTGQLTPPALVARILEKCTACGALLCWTTVSSIFCPTTLRSPQSPCWAAGICLILKAFTKLYGMAGVRLGYAFERRPRPAGRHGCRRAAVGRFQPCPSGGAGRAGRDRLCGPGPRPPRPAAPRLTAGLRALGLRVLEGRANYLLFQGPETLGAALRQKGVVLRSCANYPGLDASWYRTAVRTGPENERLLKTLAEVIR